MQVPRSTGGAPADRKRQGVSAGTHFVLTSYFKLDTMLREPANACHGLRGCSTEMRPGLSYATLRCACFCANSLRASSSAELSPLAAGGETGSCSVVLLAAAGTGSLAAPAMPEDRTSYILSCKNLSACENCSLGRFLFPQQSHAGGSAAWHVACMTRPLSDF